VIDAIVAYQIADTLARSATLNEVAGDNVSVTIPIAAWREFWDAINHLPYERRP
jgi:hypothetical protein